MNPSGSFTVDSGVLMGNTNAVLSGTMGWTAGVLEGILTLAPGSTLNITTGSNHNLQGCIFTNNGTVVWATGTIVGNNGTVIYNYGLWNAQDDSTWSLAYGSAAWSSTTTARSANRAGPASLPLPLFSNPA